MAKNQHVKTYTALFDIKALFPFFSVDYFVIK